MAMIIDGFDGLSLQQAGIMSLRSQRSWGARFILNHDVRKVFPYLNAALADARYEKQPEHIRFVYEGVQCTLYPDELVAAPFTDKDNARQYFQRLSVFLNDIYDKRDGLKPNHRKNQLVSVVEVLKLLPRTNCRRCGYPTCLAFAAALRQQKTKPECCPDFEKPLTTHEIYPVFDADGALVSTLTLEINKDALPPVKADRSRHDKSNADAGLTHPPVNREEKDVNTHLLTNRETEILRLVAAGKTNTAISKKLCISPHTVKSHVIHIFNKLGVSDRTQAAVFAIRRHLI